MLDYKDFEWEIWNGDLLTGAVIVDTETDLQPFHTRNHTLIMFQAYNGEKAVLVPLEDVTFFLEMHKNSTFVFQNAAFDIQVLSHLSGWDYWFNKIDKDLIHDTKLLYQLLALATMGSVPNRSSLKDICKNLLGREINKDNDIRCTFDQYLGQGYSQFKEEHIKYGLLDVIHTYDVYIRLLTLIKPHDTKKTLLSHSIQLKGSIALDQMYKNGVGFDLSKKAEIEKSILSEMKDVETRVNMWGYVKGKKGNTEALFSILKTLGVLDKLPLSDKSKQPKVGKEQLEPYTKFQFIEDYLHYQELDKALTFIKDVHTSRLHPRYNALVNSGRTSCSKPNFQQLPNARGIKDCFTGAEGNCLVEVDYSTIELVALSQITSDISGSSVMGQLINQGKDLHIATASSVYSVAPSKVTKEQRQFAKIPNFALPVNMGVDTFVQYCHKAKVKMDPETAQEVKNAWLRQYPEIVDYFDSPKDNVDGSRKAWSEERGRWEDRDTFLQMGRSGRKRAHCTYPAFLNSNFQGLAADGAKLALYNSFKAGLLLVGFVHDSIVVECPIERGEYTLQLLSKTMIESMETVIPDFRISTEGEVKMRYGEKESSLGISLKAASLRFNKEGNVT